MKGTIIVFIFVILLVCLPGCNTVKGAADGAVKDWHEAQKVDGWLQKNAW